MMLPAGHWPATSWVHYTTSCNTQSSAPEDGQNNCPKHVELNGIINKSLLLHLHGCVYYLYQWCTVKQISGNEIYLLIKYMKSVIWRVAKLGRTVPKVNMKTSEWCNTAHTCFWICVLQIAILISALIRAYHTVQQKSVRDKIIVCQVVDCVCHADTCGFL